MTKKHQSDDRELLAKMAGDVLAALEALNTLLTDSREEHRDKLADTLAALKSSMDAIPEEAAALMGTEAEIDLSDIEAQLGDLSINVAILPGVIERALLLLDCAATWQRAVQHSVEAGVAP